MLTQPPLAAPAETGNSRSAGVAPKNALPPPTKGGGLIDADQYGEELSYPTFAAFIASLQTVSARDSDGASPLRSVTGTEPTQPTAILQSKTKSALGSANETSATGAAPLHTPLRAPQNSIDVDIIVAPAKKGAVIPVEHDFTAKGLTLEASASSFKIEAAALPSSPGPSAPTSLILTPPPVTTTLIPVSVSTSPVAAQPFNLAAAPLAPTVETTPPLPTLTVTSATRIEVRLDPPHIGHVRIELDLSQDGATRAIVFVSDSDTQMSLRRHANGFARDLTEAGFEGVTVDIDTHSDSERFGHNHHHGNDTWTEEHLTHVMPVPTAALGAGPTSLKTDHLDILL